MYEKQLIAQNKSHTQVPTHRNGGNKMEFMIMRDYTAQKSRDYMSLVTWVGIPRWGSLSKRALPGYTQVGVVFLDETTPSWVYPGGNVWTIPPLPRGCTQVGGVK